MPRKTTKAAEPTAAKEAKEAKEVKEVKEVKETKETKEPKKAKEAVKPAISAVKEEALSKAFSDIEKKFGKGAIMKMSEKLGDAKIPVITTGILSVDLALGVGGVPKGRIVEVYGPESSGKTTLALHIVAESQNLGGICAFVDAEHALDPIYARKLGVNTEELYISQPDNGEQALEIVEAMVRSYAIDVIVVDSVAALVPKSEIEGDMGQTRVGEQARLMSHALRKLTGFTSRSNCVIIFINQLRDKISTGYSQGPSETTTGGRALKFYSSIRVEVKRGEAIKTGERQVGSRTKIRVTKNKVAPPFRTCEVDMMFGEGLSKEGDLLDLGVDLGAVKKSGSWYSYGDIRLGQGRPAVMKYMQDHPETRMEIENMVREHFGVKTLDEIASPENSIPVAATDVIPEEFDDVPELEILMLEE